MAKSPDRSGNRRFRALLATGAALAFAALSAGYFGGEPASAGAPTPASYTMSAASLMPLPDTMTVADLQAVSAGGVSTQAATPNGFKLTDPGIRRSDFVYDSDPIYLETFRCQGGVCVVQAAVKAQVHQEAIGGSSHTWRLRMNLTKYSNPGSLTWSYTTTYWCGVNVSGGSDTICASGAAPSGGVMSNNTEANKPWGSKNSITVFPMLQPTVIFSDGEHPTYKFRGWDTLSRASTTKLAASSGQGG